MSYIISDIEGTLTTGSSWRGIGTYYKANYSSIRYNLFFARWIPRYLLVGIGFMSRRTALFEWMEDEVRLFRGFSLDEFNQMARWVVEEVMWPERRQDIMAELERGLRNGAKLVVVSSAYQPIVDAFAHQLGAIAIGTPLLFKGGRLIGIQRPVNAFEHKTEFVCNHIGDEEILAVYGDTMSDLPMMELGQESIAVFPDSALREVANFRGWRIIENIK